MLILFIDVYSSAISERPRQNAQRHVDNEEATANWNAAAVSNGKLLHGGRDVWVDVRGQHTGCGSRVLLCARDGGEDGNDDDENNVPWSPRVEEQNGPTQGQVRREERTLFRRLVERTLIPERDADDEEQ